MEFASGVIGRVSGLYGVVEPPTPMMQFGVYGHGATVIRYMRHFQQCLDEDREPSPGVLDGARSVAAWESVRTGEPVEVFNGF